MAPRYLVHVHGGAWRDPRLTSASIEPAVACAFSGERPAPVAAIASLNYTVSPFGYPAPPFMANPPVPYDAIKDNHADLAREAVHPQHVSDALHGLALLGSLGLTSGSYVLYGHSADACPALQSVLQRPGHYGLGYLPEPPCPAALLGLNGLYDLPALATADGLGASHAHLRDDYERLCPGRSGRTRTPGQRRARPASTRRTSPLGSAKVTPPGWSCWTRAPKTSSCR